jgi:phage tail sheath protein FI
VRRLALHIEESIYRGTQWAAYRPDEEPLWEELRQSIGAFLHDLFRRGAFQGSDPQEAYFVHCSGETTSPADVKRGLVTVHVGFAPVRAGEFVVLRIHQLAGQFPA